jgi:hypothetical protein
LKVVLAEARLLGYIKKFYKWNFLGLIK